MVCWPKQSKCATSSRTACTLCRQRAIRSSLGHFVYLCNCSFIYCVFTSVALRVQSVIVSLTIPFIHSLSQIVFHLCMKLNCVPVAPLYSRICFDLIKITFENNDGGGRNNLPNSVHTWAQRLLLCWRWFLPTQCTHPEQYKSTFGYRLALQISSFWIFERESQRFARSRLVI